MADKILTTREFRRLLVLHDGFEVQTKSGQTFLVLRIDGRILIRLVSGLCGETIDEESINPVDLFDWMDYRQDW